MEDNNFTNNTQENNVQNQVQPIPEQQPTAPQNFDQAFNESISEMKRKKTGKTIAIIAAIVAVLGIAVFALSGPLMQALDPKAYVLNAYSNTFKNYEAEIKLMQENNAVLKELSDIRKGKSLTTIGIPVNSSFTLPISLQDDPTTKQMMLETQIYAPNDLGIYISNNKMTLKTPSGSSVYADTKTFFEDMKRFMSANGQDADAFTIPEGFEFNYDTIHGILSDWNTLQNLPTNQKYKGLQEKYLKLMAKLIEYANVSSSDDNVKIGSLDINCRKVTIELDETDVQKWLKEVYDTLKDDKEIEDLYANVPGGFSSIIDNIEIASENYEGDLELTSFIKDDKVVLTRFEYDNGSQEATFEIGAIGEKYALDHIYFSGDVNGEKAEAEIKGNHIGSGIFDSNIEASVGSTKVFDMDIKWDTASASNNFAIKSAMFNYTFTFAKAGDSVSLDLPNLPIGTVATKFSRFSGTITEPVATKKLFDCTMQELQGMLMPSYLQ